MKPNSSEILTSLILVTLVFSLFIFSAILRIRNSWKIISSADKPKSHKILRKFDLVFSSIVLIASIVFYLIFIVNFGK